MKIDSTEEKGMFGMESRRKMAVAAMILFIIAFYTGRVQKVQNLSNADFIRFHVVANSDSAEDQALKLQVRDGVLEEINRGMAEYTMAQADPSEKRVELTLEQSREYVKTHLDEIQRTGERIVRTMGYDYPVDADLEICEIPEKTYGNVTFPEGTYEALNVTIGSGGGRNWWCVLFPPLCLVGAVPSEEGMVPEETEALELYRNAVWDPKYDQLLKAAEKAQPVKLELKFKVLEILSEA